MHKYPLKKQIPHRYTQKDFEKYKEITNNLENYEKWKIGINYETNRKIKVSGKTHEKLGENFHIKKYNSPYSYSYVIFTVLDNTDSVEYIEETQQIQNEINEYNDGIADVIIKINLLDDWDDFIEYKGIKYGLHCVHNDVHKENNCNGIMEFYEDLRYECRNCDKGWGRSCDCINYTVCKCNKCGYTAKQNM